MRRSTSSRRWARIRLLGAAVALSLVAAACSGDDPVAPSAVDRAASSSTAADAGTDTGAATTSDGALARLREIVGEDELAHLAEVELTDSEEVAGFAEPLDQELDRWRIVIGPTRSRDEQDHVLAHEYGHVVAGNGDQNKASTESCATLNLYGNCPNEDSHIYRFIQQFWEGPALSIWDELRAGAEVLPFDSEPEMIDRISAHPDLDCQFVTEEAKVDPAEDFAETYAALVLETKPLDNCGSEKVSWLSESLGRTG